MDSNSYGGARNVCQLLDYQTTATFNAPFPRETEKSYTLLIILFALSISSCVGAVNIWSSKGIDSNSPYSLSNWSCS